MQTAKQKVEAFAANLESYVTTQGIPVALPRHIDHYINMPRSELATQSSKDLAEMEFEMHSQAYYLQTCHNKQLAKADKCLAEIDLLVGPVLDNYKNIYGLKEKMMAAINDNTHALEWKKVEINARAAATRTMYLSQIVSNMAKSLQNIMRRRHDG